MQSLWIKCPSNSSPRMGRGVVARGRAVLVRENLRGRVRVFEPPSVLQIARNGSKHLSPVTLEKPPSARGAGRVSTFPPRARHNSVISISTSTTTPLSSQPRKKGEHRRSADPAVLRLPRHQHAQRGRRLPALRHGPAVHGVPEPASAGTFERSVAVTRLPP